MFWQVKLSPRKLSEERFYFFFSIFIYLAFLTCLSTVSEPPETDRVLCHFCVSYKFLITCSRGKSKIKTHHSMLFYQLIVADRYERFRSTLNSVFFPNLNEIFKIKLVCTLKLYQFSFSSFPTIFEILRCRHQVKSDT